MSPSASTGAGRPAIDLIEEAVHALRRARPVVHAAYLVGVVPFLLGVLFFLADMSRSPFAADRCVPASLGLAALYVWMRCWQTVACRLLRAEVSGITPAPWRGRDLVRLVALHSALSPVSLLLLFSALLAVLPYAWAFAFHQSLVTACTGSVPTVTEGWREAWRQAFRWPYQNHFALSLLALFGLVVLINLLVVTIYLPYLLKSLLGLDSTFTQSPWWILNTTYWASLFGLQILCVGPLEKAVYTLRCFYGDAVNTGQDLLSSLSGLTRPVRRVALALLLLALLGLASPARGEVPPPEAPAPTVDASRLDQAVDQTLRDPSYAWRMPRDAVPVPVEERSLFGRFAHGIGEMFKTIFRWMARTLEEVVEWIFRQLRLREPGPDGDRAGGLNWPALLQGLMWVLILVLAGVLVWLVLRSVKRRRHRPRRALSEMVPERPDLEDEQVIASQLPEDEWLAMAQELRRAGELRKALRAYFLGTLARLARFDLVSISRAKSNAEYRRELQRKVRRQPELDDYFVANIHLYERGWYGLYEVSEADLETFVHNLEALVLHEPEPA